MREAVRLRELRIQHIPGQSQMTKAFSRPRLQELVAEQEVIKSDSPAKVNGTRAVLAKLVLTMGWTVQGSRASTFTEPLEHGLEVSLPARVGWAIYLIRNVRAALQKRPSSETSRNVHAMSA